MTTWSSDPFDRCLIFVLFAVMALIILIAAYVIFELILEDAEASQAVLIGAVIATMCIFLPLVAFGIISLREPK